MIPKRFDQIRKDDIEALITNAVREGREIDYKEQLPTGQDEDKKEFLADVSSFANAAGGDIVYGIKEQRDAKGRATGIPESAVGLSEINADQEVQRLENMIRSGIEPRIASVHIKPFDGFPEGPIIVIRVPQSWTPPHMVAFKASPRFFSRTSAGKAPLDVSEIRSAFLQSSALPDRARRFREERVGRIIAGEAPVPLIPGPVVALHIVPLRYVESGAGLDILGLETKPNLLRPMGARGWTGRINLDGYVNANLVSDRSACLSYSLIFRNGPIEGVDAINPARPQGFEKVISPISFERDLISGLKDYLAVYESLDVQPPFVVMLSLLNVRGYSMYADPMLPDSVQPIDRNHVLVPDVIVDDAHIDAAMILLSPR